MTNTQTAEEQPPRVDTPEAGPGEGGAVVEGWTEELTPRQVVAELDKYIVGQAEAKKAVAIALRNRWRRQRVDADLREEIMPNNIIMIGPTGVGKTEIARRLAKLAGAPFVKVEASKFTEVGYVGRDVESMIRDLVDVAINMVRNEREDEVQEVAEQRAEERLLDLLLPPVDEAHATTPAESEAPPERPRAFVVSPRGEVSSSDTDGEEGTETLSSGTIARARSSAPCCARRSSRSGPSRWR